MELNDVRTIVANLDDFLELPDGIERLRKAVLTLAVSGRLVPQDPKDGTGEELYAKIQNERVKRGTSENGRKRKKEDLLPIDQAKTPFEIPTSWKWVRLGDVVEFRVGKTPPRVESKYWSAAEIPWVSISDLINGGTIRSTKESINELALREVFRGYKAPAGSLLFSFKLTIGKMSILEMDACHNEAIAAFISPDQTLRDYLFNILPILNLTGRTSNAIKGYTLNGDTLPLIEIPLPPSGEQSRMIDKIKGVMSSLDELEAKEKERDSVRARLTRSAMRTLGEGNRKLPLQHLPELIKSPLDIKELENAILRLAVSGKLVPQDAKEGTAEELFVEIREKRIEQENSGSGRKRKITKLFPVNAPDTPFKIPASWKWVRLGDVMSISSGDSLKVSEATEGPYLVYGGNGIAGRHSSFNAARGTIVIGRVGALCGIAHITESDAWVTDNAFIVDYPETLLDKQFFLQTLNYLNLRASHRGSAQPVISGISVYPIPMPLPPLAEQKRIVEKVQELQQSLSELKRSV